jgi:Tol biopolymer transport system component
MDRSFARRLAVLSGVACVALAAAAPAQATFPGGNGRIAFAAYGSSGEEDPPFEVDGLSAAFPGEGSERELIGCELTGGVPSGGDCTARSFDDPSYAPDGRRIVFDAGERIGLIDADGGRPRLLPAVTTNDGDPAFAPDGRRIVFTGANDHGRTDLYVRRVGGGAARLIIQDAEEPAWSSRGVLTYVRTGNIYLARPGGRHRRWVTSGISPDWSPDGRRLLLVRPSPRNVFDAPVGRVYVVRPSGRGLRRVGPAFVSHPVWSPDGRWLAYSEDGIGIVAYRLPAPLKSDGFSEDNLVAEDQIGDSGANTVSDPAWRPRPRPR